ncbi:MAG TPA: TlpA disulfide reductase family protein [Baekduia sp.]|nr:TlpA disulfide reductase family protein [Baekduia sp.]
MRRLSVTAWVVGLLAAGLVGLLVFGLTANSDDTSIDDAVRRGERPAAPDQQRQLPQLRAAGTKSLSDYRGKVVVLNFWAAWCDPCANEAPILEKAHKALAADRSGTVLGAIYDGSIASSLEFEQRHGLTFPSLRDVGTELAEQFGTRNLPETFVLDAKGRIVAVSRGEISEAFLTDAIARAKAA